MSRHKANEVSAPDYAASGWYATDNFRMERVPQGLRSWLEYEGLLTSRLGQACGNGFRLRVLDQRAADPGELDGGGLCREIALECGPLRAVFARSLIPVPTLVANPWLGALGDFPLGEALMSRSGIIRGPFNYAELRPGQPLYQASLPKGAETPAALFARRSEFRIADHRLWVCEVFLPAICHCNPAETQ